MTVIVDLLISGWISGIAIAILWIETAGLSLLSENPPHRFRTLSANACSGTCLLLAAGLALRDADPIWVLMLFAGSLVFHGLDIALRYGLQADGLRRRTE